MTTLDCGCCEVVGDVLSGIDRLGVIVHRDAFGVGGIDLQIVEEDDPDVEPICVDLTVETARGLARALLDAASQENMA